MDLPLAESTISVYYITNDRMDQDSAVGTTHNRSSGVAKSSVQSNCDRILNTENYKKILQLGWAHGRAYFLRSQEPDARESY